MNRATGVERFYEDAAYLAALVVYLLEHRHDHETDAEIAEVMENRPWTVGIVVDVLKVMA